MNSESKKKFALWAYASIAILAFAFFYSVLTNKNSRYSQRLEQYENRVSNRQQLMREYYLKQDSLFRREQDSLNKLEQQQKANP
ncbi:MAG: hypothetical protein U0Y96_09750 [Candidatus Kapaibacterium sp.]